MKYLFLYFIIPAAVSFLVQTILCHKVKKGILRHGALIFTIIPVVLAGILLFTQCGGMFGGLGAVAAALWLINACCTALGYGIAWLVHFIMEKGKIGRKKMGAAYEEENRFISGSGNDSDGNHDRVRHRGHGFGKGKRQRR